MKKCGDGQMLSVFILNYDTCKTDVTHVRCVGLTLCAVIRRLLHPIDSPPSPTTHARHKQIELFVEWTARLSTLFYTDGKSSKRHSGAPRICESIC